MPESEIDSYTTLPQYSLKANEIDSSSTKNPGTLSIEGYLAGPHCTENNCATAAALQVAHSIQIGCLEVGQIAPHRLQKWDGLYTSLRTALTFK